MQPQAVIERIGELTKGDAIVVTDVGQHQMWAAQYYPYQNERQLVTSGGLGTMGFGVPAAIGAKIANPDRKLFSCWRWWFQYDQSGTGNLECLQDSNQGHHA